MQSATKDPCQAGTNATTPEAQLTAKLTAAVKPWLKASDQWRIGNDVLPETEDSLVAYCRVAGLKMTHSEGPRGRFSTDIDGAHWRIGDNQGDCEGAGYSPSEAAADLLREALERVCVGCGGWDSVHDRGCPVLLEDDGPDYDEINELRQAHALDGRL